jgi:hypothetical protein
MRHWDPEDVVGALILVGLFLAGLLVVGWLLWSAVNDHRDQSRCRDRGGNVEHLPAPVSDWRCVGAQPERAP